MITSFAGVLVRAGVGERLARVAAWVIIILAAGIVIGMVKLKYDTRVVERHQSKIQQREAPVREKAADERADDALRNASLRAERDAAIAKAEALEAAKAPEARATVAPQNRALNCARLREAGMTGSAVYREVCL